MPKEKSDFQINLEYIFVRFFVGFIGRLPLSLALETGVALGKLFQKIAKKQNRIADTNLRLALPNLTDAQRDEIVRGTFENLGRQLGFLSFARRLKAEKAKNLFDVKGIEHLEKAEKTGRGIFILTGHLGGWEVLMTILPLFAAPANTIIRPLDNPRINKFAENVRSTFGTRVISRKTSVRQKAAQALGKGEKIVIIPDVNWQERGGVFVDFFGVQASTAVGLAKMTLENDAVVLPAFLIWQKDKKRYSLEFDELIEFEKTASEEENFRDITQKATAAIEKYVRLFPEQWLWIHKRWNTRPKGEKSIY